MEGRCDDEQPGRGSVRNEHRLVITEDTSSEYYCPEAVAGKTGYLLKAGNTLVTYGEKDGRRVVSVILKGSPRQYFIDGKNRAAVWTEPFPERGHRGE